MKKKSGPFRQGRAGREPLEARSAYGMRLVLALAGTGFFVAVAVISWVLSTEDAWYESVAIIAVILAAIALVDTGTVLTRMRRRRR